MVDWRRLKSASAVRLTDAQVGILKRAQWLQDSYKCAGYFPRGGAYRAVRALEKLGLMRFVGDGRDVDGEVENDVPIWEITNRGRRALVVLGE